MSDPTDTLFWAKNVGYKIRERRKKLGLSLEDLSLLSGATVSTVSNIERGKRDVKLSTLISLALALRIKPQDLFHEDNDLSKNPNLNLPGYDLDND